MVVDPTNNFLYVASALSSQVFAFHMNTSAGTLSPLSSPSPTGSDPVSMVLLPSVNSVGQNFNGYGQFLFVSNNGSSNIAGFTLNTTDGVMENPITVIAPASPSGMAVQ
jgi:DNA-binding beta-propeller fold protein YncE